MATTITLPKYPRSKLVLPASNCVRSRMAVMVFAVCLHKNAYNFGKRFYSQPFFHHESQPYSVCNLKKMSWHIGSSVDDRGFDPSSADGSNGRTRLVRAIQAFQSKVVARIQELKKDLPMKLFFFLVGFYCATAFATVIGQTGDWDIFSAALAVVVVEGIGALMYGASLPLLSKIRILITMFNYWKAGLSLGLFLDSFKYEIGNIMGSSNPFNFEIDILPPFF